MAYFNALDVCVPSRIHVSSGTEEDMKGREDVSQKWETEEGARRL